jgi:hypothetical protein
VVGSVDLHLLRLAEEICRRYRNEFPDEQERYGEAGQAWCVHDLQHLLNWAAGEVNGHFEMRPQVTWLAAVLEAREFPLDRLARSLDIAADVVSAHLGGAATGAQLVRVLRNAAGHVRQSSTFLRE